MLRRPPPPPPLLDAGVASEGHLPKGFAETLPGGPAENHRKSVAWGRSGGHLGGISKGPSAPLDPRIVLNAKQLDLLVFHPSK